MGCDFSVTLFKFIRNLNLFDITYIALRKKAFVTKNSYSGNKYELSTIFIVIFQEILLMIKTRTVYFKFFPENNFSTKILIAIRLKHKLICV